MAERARFTEADQVLINALTVLAFRVHVDAKRDRMFMDVLRMVLPAASAEHPQMMPLIAAAKGFFDGPVFDRPREYSARWRAERSLIAFFEWRSGQALDAFRATQGEVVDA